MKFFNKNKYIICRLILAGTLIVKLLSSNTDWWYM
ncbi:hypothetical protein JOC28_001489 [Streptococcus loxodontisalivarius]|uniref:Uncharacterized protein n=1 Tax=Streptococcus loxodontisalivarius TaxID=1349415 RepID=A0ABS2PT29_9STRE|nr:hypothetical protein [Streptococcus loxodontisalivarius]